MENTGIPNAADQTVAKQVEKAKRNKYKIPILSDRETDLSKINPKNAVGADIGVNRVDLSKEARRVDRTGDRLHGPTYNLSH